MKGSGIAGRVEVPPFLAAPGILITARSHFIDRIVADCEIVALPAKTVPGGQLRYREVNSFPAYLASSRKWPFSRRTPKPEPMQGDLGIDLRINSPQNWAHFLTNHLPLTFLLCHELGLSYRDLVLILPADTPPYISSMANLLELKVQQTDAEVIGRGIAFDLDNWNVLRPERRKWVEQSGALSHLAKSSNSAEVGFRKVFLARRKTRNLSNQAEIESLLSSLEFITVYPEDLDAAGQFRLFHEAEQIVAVHGAAIAPLLYRQPDSRLSHLIEILPCGHMTDVFRVMAQQVGCAWTGVRGRIKPEYVKPAYLTDVPYIQHSLDSFEVDPISLKKSLEYGKV